MYNNNKVVVSLVTLATLTVANTFAALSDSNEVFSWKDLSYKWPSEEVKSNAIGNGEYIVENNLPLGLARWNNKLFVTVPRWKTGVASTLNYIPLNETDPSPALIPYPDWESHQLPEGNETARENTVVSIFRVYVDECDRLWALDSGLVDIFGDGKQITPPTILVWDLKTDKLINRYALKSSDVVETSFFANIIVDVTADKCDQAFAYIPDLGGYGLVVYSLADNETWRIRHNYFHFDPLKGDLVIGGVNFQWNDGLFSVALGPVDNEGFRTAYFHPMISDCEFSVNTKVWKNKTLALDRSSYHSYKFEGNKGEKSQTGASIYDQSSNVVFFAFLQQDGVACWNTKKQLKPENVALVAQDHEKILFPNDIKVDQDRNLWILSDKLPHFFEGRLNHNQINYRILRIPVDEAIKNTACAP